jgi:hypothetical protein
MYSKKAQISPLKEYIMKTNMYVKDVMYIIIDTYATQQR